MYIKKMKLFLIIFILIIACSQDFISYVHAEELSSIIVIENPTNLLEYSGDIQISGYVFGKDNISKVDIYVDGTNVGQASYGLPRQDVFNKYPNNNNSLNSGYTYKFNSRGYNDGNHEIRVESVDVNLNKTSSTVAVIIKNQRTSIMGASLSTKYQLINYFQQNNDIKDFNYINNFVDILIEEASIEGVRADVAFVQMMKETNFLKFTGGVREWQNNFAGLGSTGTIPTDPNIAYGEKFDSMQIGIRAVIQHLQCYATTDPLKLPKVDTRYGSWLRGKAPYVEWLGTNENPYGTGWATDLNYGYDIVNKVNKVASSVVVISKAKITSFIIPNEYYLNQTVTGSATAASPNGVVYRFFEVDKSTGVWKLIQDYSDKNTFSWTPSKIGQYMLVVQAKDKYSSYVVDETLTKDVDVKSDKAKVTALNVGTEFVINKSITGSATAESPNGVLYRFFEVDKSTGVWKLIQDYSDKSTFSWTPSKIGQYMLVVQAKDKYSSYVVDETLTKDVDVKSDKAKVTALNVGTEFVINKSITGSATAESPNGVLYRFFEVDKSTGVWKLIQDYSDKNTFSWTPSKIGQYMLVVQVKDKYSSYVVDETLTKDVDVKSDKAKITALNVGTEFVINKSITGSATAESPNGALYRFFEVDKSTGVWKLIQDYSEKNTFSWTPSKIGQYMLVVQAKDKYSSYAVDETLTKDIDVKSDKAKVTALNVGTEFVINKSITGSATAESPNGALYRFFEVDKSTGVWKLIQDYSEKSTFSWTPSKIGQYMLVVQVKDMYSSYVVDETLTKEVDVKSDKAKVTALNVGTEFVINKSITGSATAESPNGVLYRFFEVDKITGVWKLIQDYSEKSTFSWTPSKIGQYMLVVQVKDMYSSYVVDETLTKDVDVKSDKAKIAVFNVGTEFVINKNIVGSASATSPNGVLYRFFEVDKSTGIWKLIQDYSVTNTFNWTPVKVGQYMLVVQAKDKYSSYAVDETLTKDIDVKSDNLSGKTIVLDAGHNYGGDDGAYRTFGNIIYSERDLNMQMVLKLKVELEKLGANVVLTRDENDRSVEDQSTSLKKRVDIANNANADLFISLHHDVSSDANVTGISTHYSTYKPGIDNSGVITANDPYGWYNGVNIDTTPSDAAIISRELAIKLAAELSSSLGYNNYNAHDHNLFVTVNTNMPAVLIEEGFLSNQAEAERCANSEQQVQKAQKIAQIINDYFKA